MLELFLIRHGKASQDYFSNDFERELVTAGIQKTAKLSELVKPKLPDEFQIWTSPAKRAFQTALEFVENLGLQKPTSVDALYTFNCSELVNQIKKCSDSTQNLIIFGHNTAITDFVNQYGSVYIDNVPTSGLVSIQFENQNWNSISKGKTNLIIFPKLD